MNKINKDIKDVNNVNDIVTFKQEINDLITECLKSENEDRMRLLSQMMTYFVRMKNVYSCCQSDDDDKVDDDTEDNFLSDESDTDYTKIMENRVYSSQYNSTRNYITNDNLDSVNNEIEKKITKKLLGINDMNDGIDVIDVIDYNRNNFYDISDNNLMDDNSVDQMNYLLANNENSDHGSNDNSNDNNNENSNHVDDENTHDVIQNNTKKTLKEFVAESYIEIIDKDQPIDYNEPTID